MKLKKYLQDKNVHEFSKKIRISHQLMYAYARRAHTPSLKIAAKIVKATDGQVTFWDLIVR